MRILKQWKKKEFIASISGKVADNLYAACQFAADRARPNAPRRSGTLLENIDIEVEVTAREETLEGRVGVRKEAYWAYFQEMGTRYHAAHPFLRPAVFDNAREIVRLIQGG